MTKLELGGALIGVMVVVFTLGFFANDKISNSSQPAQVFSILKSSASKTQATTTTQRVATPAPAETTPAPSLWRKFKDTATNQSYTEMPQATVQALLGFCEQLRTSFNQQTGSQKLAWRDPRDGKYYCLNSNGSVSSSTCGNGSQSSCVASGCCGSCIGGVLPPGITDLTQLPNLFFVPNRIIEAIENRTR